MARTRQVNYYVGDFETTVYEGQTSTEVWASAIVPLYSEDVTILHSIQETFDYLVNLKQNLILYYHNLKFDGTFWLDYLITGLHYRQASLIVNGNIQWMKDKDMPNKSFKYMISDMGQWYTIIIRVGKYTIEIRDSLKLLPFSVRKIGKSFKTKHQKLDMDYEGYRYAGCTITDEEKKYIANDVLVVKEALEIMMSEGHDKLTIGSCCMEEYKKSITMIDEFDKLFPDLYDIKIDEAQYGCADAGTYIRRSYHGGWCYVVPEKANKLYHKGLTADVNSLYPSMMSSESGNYYPVGKPSFFIGGIPSQCKWRDDIYYFVRIRTRFKIKKNKLPCIQIKNNFLYKPTEWLTTSDILGKDGKYYDKYYDLDGNLVDAYVTLTLTQTDYELIQDHYDLIDCTILDGCYFYARIGIFDEYINKYRKIKMESTGAIRELAKLFLNNLYGKMASSRNSSFKVAMPNPISEDYGLVFKEQEEYNKQAGYIACGSAITSYARYFTITTAQKNYYGADKRGFIYADTDSIHCDLNPEELVGVPVHDTAFCHWKLESFWDEGWFVRQKTYAEHVTHENQKPIDHPYYNVKCAGLSEHGKNLFMYSMEKKPAEYWEKTLGKDWEDMDEDEKEFVLTPRDITDFKTGLLVPAKLMPKIIKGGTILVRTTFRIK